ncbi:glycosyltransferase [Flectobacillus longus]|uniref:glycosyltransferase n=1 Tax=Flectobacillus longus TaxID=2984207 RepID=UPI0024B83E33|nr:glycosyltransferase [Flectobacillus longus]MDI9878166.1 glycosyltransferase [Flectobacillus longus]
MNILIFHNAVLPVIEYGGTERALWWLTNDLVRLGHRVTLLVAKGSTCPFAEVIFYNPNISLTEQIPDYIDVVHLSIPPPADFHKPYILMVQGNPKSNEVLDQNTVFVSQNHAFRHNSNAFVYNGLDFDEYPTPSFSNQRKHVHFLANASWKVKNLNGAVNISKKANEKLMVMGGSRINFRMGFRFTPDLHVKFFGMVGGKIKFHLMDYSKALLFPVLWHEPFGIAIIESLYMGAFVLGTPYGSLPELITSEVGFLSNREDELIEKLKYSESFNPKISHEYVRDTFSSRKMALNYLKYYELVLSGKKINPVAPKATFDTPKYLPYYT